MLGNGYPRNKGGRPIWPPHLRTPSVSSVEGADEDQGVIVTMTRPPSKRRTRLPRGITFVGILAYFLDYRLKFCGYHHKAIKEKQ